MQKNVYRIAHLTVPCPSHKNFNIKLLHFVRATAIAGGRAIVLPVYSYRRAKNGTVASPESFYIHL